MLKHPLPTLAVLCAIALSSRAVTAGAQVAPSTFKVLGSNGTSDEQSILRTVTDRLSKKAADPTFTKSLDDAAARGDYKMVGKLLADAISVKVSEILMSGPTKVGASRHAETPFRFATNRALFNPWYVIFSVGDRVYCASTSVSTCQAALGKMGYKDTHVVW